MQMQESFVIAFDVVRNNKMRSFLTLLGIIIGVSAIIGMQSLIEGFQKDMEEQMEQLGSNVFQVQKYPVMGGGRDDRERLRNRKDITMLESDAIEKYCWAVDLVGPEVWAYGRTVKYRDKKTSPTIVLAGGHPGFFPNNGYFIDQGRAISEIDVNHNRDVVVLGMDAVEELFPFQDPIGEEVNID